MNAADITARIADALVKLHDEQAAQLAEWRNLYIAIGRAVEAAERGDAEAARAALLDAESAEYSLLGSCDVTGAIVQAIDGGEIKEDNPS